MESVIEFKLPALGENIEQGDLVRLMIAPGATVAEGQTVMELETDKAVVEVPSSVSGKVQEILVKEGDKIKVGQVIFTVENNGRVTAAASKAPRREEAASASTEVQPVRSADAPVLDTPVSETPASDTAASDTTASSAAAEKAATATAPPQQPRKEQQRNRSTDAPAPTEFRLQELGENISQGDLVRLMIAPGAKVSEGQPVMELETDKAVV